jgi:serine/threonine-protein kinase
MAENPILNDRYRLIEQIGSGGMAVLYKAQDMELGRMVAVKLLRPSLVSDPEFLIRFKREARAAANLSHPNIVTVFDVGQDGPNTHYIVMEYVPGQDLKQLIRAQGAFEVDTALAIIIEVCKGVGYAHRAGLIHCDIKPQNILVTPEHKIKVADFGIARAFTGAGVQEQEAVEDVVWGSPHYFSPEQAAGEPPTPASDVYSIGIVMFELLTGQLPFTGSDYKELAMAHFSQEPPSILNYNPALPPELDRIIRKVLSKEPAARYRTADQLGRILQKYREEANQPTTSGFAIHPSSAPAVHDTPPEPQPPHGATPLPPQDERTIVRQAPTDLPPAPQPSRAAYSGYYEPEPGPVPSRATYSDYRYEQYDEYDGAEYEPAFDWYGLVLGVLAVVAVLGLIPLWITVYLTFTR